MENTENMEIILKEFAKFNVDKSVLTALKNFSNPIYAKLSEHLKLPKREIYRVILNMQPRILTKQNR